MFIITEATRATIMDLEMQLDRERALRMHLEQKLQRLEELYPEKMATDITTEQVTLHYHDEDEVCNKTCTIFTSVIITCDDVLHITILLTN